MKAVVINRFGNANVLEVTDRMPVPEPQDHQVLIRVKAAGINPLDVRTRNGELKWLVGSKFPMILGNDASGIIVKCGKKVTSFREGEAVCCMVDGNRTFSLTGFAGSGAYAEYCVTREDTLARLPVGLSFVEAAAVPVSGMTAYQALVEKGQLYPGAKVLINGASGGVGTFAVMLAKAIGAEVTAVCSDKHFERMKDVLGVSQVLDYRTMNLSAMSDRYDVIYDVASVLSFKRCRCALEKNGIYIANVMSPATWLSTWLAPVFQVFGNRQRSTYVWVEPSGFVLGQLTSFMEKYRIRPLISEVFSLEKAHEAHVLLESRGSFGKMVFELT